MKKIENNLLKTVCVFIEKLIKSRRSWKSVNLLKRKIISVIEN